MKTTARGNVTLYRNDFITQLPDKRSMANKHASHLIVDSFHNHNLGNTTTSTALGTRHSWYKYGETMEIFCKRSLSQRALQQLNLNTYY